MIWAHANPQHPCPICGKPDWCTFGDKAMLCQRVESPNAFHKGGWFHFYDADKPEYIPKPRAEAQPPKSIDALGMMRQWRLKTTDLMIVKLSLELGVSSESLRELKVAWCAERNAWAFPMHDSEGNMSGIRLRSQSGFKWAVPGSQGGLFLPTFDMQRRVFIPEGPTSTAALKTFGFDVIGRPSANSGFDIIRKVLKSMPWIWEAVIVADNDDLKKMGPYEKKRVGIESAVKLKAELGIKSCIWIPPSPCKDSRDYLKAGGTREYIEQDLKDKIWTRK